MGDAARFQAGEHGCGRLTLTAQQRALLASAQAHPERLITLDTDLLPGRDAALVELHKLRDRRLLEWVHGSAPRAYRLTLAGERVLGERAQK